MQPNTKSLAYLTPQEPCKHEIVWFSNVNNANAEKLCFLGCFEAVSLDRQAGAGIKSMCHHGLPTFSSFFKNKQQQKQLIPKEGQNCQGGHYL